MKLIATIAAALVAVTLAPASAGAAEPTRVLIVGDSVTHGLDGNYTWRYFAWKGLMQTGANVDFVGNREGTYLDIERKWAGSYAEADFDNDHAARWGMAMWEMQHQASSDTPTIGDLVTAQQPDVVVEQLGVNDFDRVGVSAGEMADQVRAFVAEARSSKADVDVVLGSIPQTWIREVGAYNALLPGLAAELSTSASRVVATPVADFTNSVDTYDFAHPTTEGQVKIAAAVSAGLADLGIGRAVTMPVPSAPAPSEPTTSSAAPAPVPTAAPTSAPAAPVLAAPAAPRKVKAIRDGSRARVTWRSVAGAEQYVVRCGKRSTEVERTKAVVRTPATSCKVRAVGAGGVSSWTKARVRR